MLGKADFCKRKGDMELKFHYLMMNSKYGYDNPNYMEEIYENTDDVELIKKTGAEIYQTGGIQAMEYSAFAFCEGLIFLVHMDAKTQFEQNELYHTMKYQLQITWDGVGE